VPAHRVTVTGIGSALLPPFGSDLDAEARTYLRNPKLLKFTGLQDRLALIACGRALATAGLGPDDLGDRAGIFLTSGYLPFERADIETLLAASIVDGSLSLQAFSTAGIAAVNPLLTFRCLPNMPAYHVSAAFNIQGSYVTTYPGPGQLQVALEVASAELDGGAVDIALVCGVAHQRNFLVEHHFNRIDTPVDASRLADAAGCLVLERPACADRPAVRPVAHLLRLETTYRPFDPSAGEPPPHQKATDTAPLHDCELGPAELPLALLRASGSGPAVFRHELLSREGMTCSSVWEIL